LIGRDGPLIGSALKEVGVPLIFASDMSNAVQQANALAQKNDAVLLSPACASFDMFRDYQHRAAVFIAAVKNLVKAAS
jgi:UDP-N-acetylmuramoylalanine--D-glutamate ligase